MTVAWWTLGLSVTAALFSSTDTLVLASLRELEILVSPVPQTPTASSSQDAPSMRSMPILPISPLAQAPSAFPGVNAPVSNTTAPLFGYPAGNSSTASSSDSPYSITSSFSALSDQLSAPSLEGYRDSSDAMRLAQSQSQSQQQLPPLGVYTRRSPDASGYQPFQESRPLPTFDMSSEADLGSWRGYSSYTRGP